LSLQKSRNKNIISEDMKFRKIATVVNCLILALLLGSCDSSDDSDPELPVDENTIAKYSLTFRGQTSSWTDENPDDARFSLHHAPTETDGYYTIGIAMTYPTGPPSQSHGVTFTGLVADKNIKTGTMSPVTYSLVHIHDYTYEGDCFDNPQCCAGIGFALVQGTEPSSESGSSLPGMDNDIHSQSGSLTITSFTITENEGAVIKGRVSGNFSISGINTNASKPNPGTASGSFENAPFSTLAFQ